MLAGIDPLLTGSLLAPLDAMGHSDSVVVADAHFPAARLAHRVVDLPGYTAPRVLTALRTVIPLDAAPSLDLMRSAEDSIVPVQEELIASAGAADSHRYLDRFAFYEAASAAFLIIRTGETRVYGNAILRKGIVEEMSV